MLMRFLGSPTGVKSMRPIVVLALVFTGILFPAISRADEDAVDYVQDIKPILSRRCYSCHGALQQKNDLRLDTAALAKKGGSGGPAVVSGKIDESLLIDAVTGADGVQKMPSEGEPLTDEEIGKLRKWIEQGAKAPDEKTPEDPTKHWAYQPPVRAALPVVKDARWGGNPVDAFIALEHQQRGLKASAPAEKNVLLRRVYLDLVGLPPTREELHAFLADDAADAYEKVVDRLLESPHYGERWGRHWMDVWRYSDWDGYGNEVRESQPHIWRWRDWIIESLNSDKPYDRMIVEMLAGDELAPADPKTVRATGFLVRNWYKFNRNVWIDYTVEHTAKGFLGTTMNCARCHDHMYDPIAQEDYYRFRAFFEPHNIRTDRVPGEDDPTKAGLVRVYDADATAATFLFTRGDEKNPKKENPLTAGLPGVISRTSLEFEPVSLSPAAYYPGSREFVHDEESAKSRAAVAKAEKDLKDAGGKLAAAKQKLQEFVAAKPAEPAAPPQLVPVLADDFATAKPELWTTGPGDWEYKEGRLLQKDTRDAVTALVSVKPHPADFVAKFKFRTTGGDTYKSVGLSFDADEDKEFWGVYLSATGKLSILRRVNGKDTYFNDGAVPFPVELNRDYELQVAVRGDVANISVDGKMHLVYKLTGERRKEGRFAVWTFDAAAEFINASVAELPKEFAVVEKLEDAGKPSQQADFEQSVRDAERKAALAESARGTAQAALTWTLARVEADRANYAVPPAPNAKELSLAAGRAEREHTLRAAELAVLQAEDKLASARAAEKPQDDKSKKAVADSETALVNAKKSLDAAREALSQPLENYTRFGPVYPATSTGRRTALAAAIVDRQNPLTARVAINQMWMRHFGTPLVPTVFDFGLNGKPPTHPELLDWLAVEFMENGWKMKPIHRLIVTSNAYRQQSTISEETAPNKTVDPDNVFVWRMNVRRMEAEIVRDSTLHIAGSLDRTMGGEEIDQNAGMTNPRRSVYFRNSKEKKMTFMEVFDRPNVVECYRRSESIVPQQALALANSPLALAQSRVLAGTLSNATRDDAKPADGSEFITAAFEQILSRPPTDEERAECEKFLGEQAARFADTKSLTAFTAGTPSPVKPAADPHQRARENLVHVLLNHNDFLTVR
jgi:mono/diheme cytochrome c family protein